MTNERDLSANNVADVITTMTNFTIDITYSSNGGFVVFEIIIRLLLAFVGTLGNTFVIFVVVMTPKLRTMPNAFVTCLAFLDLIASIVLVPFIVLGTVANRWPLSQQSCRVHGYMLALFHALSLNILGLIALNRFLNITKPLHIYRRFSSPRLFVVQILGAIVFAGLAVLCPVFGVGRVDFMGFNPVLGHCSFSHDVEGVWLYELTLMAMGFVIATIVIPFNYIKIWRYVRESRSRVNAWSGAPSINVTHTLLNMNQAVGKSGHSTIPIFNHVIPRRRALHKDNLRLTRNLLLLFLTFEITFIPFCFLVVFDRDYDLSVWLWRTVDVMLWSSSAINPYLYAWMTSSFRDAFKSLILNRHS